MYLVPDASIGKSLDVKYDISRYTITNICAYIYGRDFDGNTWLTDCPSIFNKHIETEYFILRLTTAVDVTNDRYTYMVIHFLTD